MSHSDGDRATAAINDSPEPAVIDPLREAVGDLIDALGDELKHEVNYSSHVQEHIRAVVMALNDDRYTSYLDAWWLGGDEMGGQLDDA